MSLAVDLQGVGMPQEQATRLGFSALTTIAAAGTTQGTATAIPLFVNNVLGTAASSSATGLRLPASAELTMPYVVQNGSTSQALTVYPPTGGILNNQAVNTGIVIPAHEAVDFVRVSATRWHTLSSAPNSASGIPAAGTFSILPSNWHTGAIPAQVSTDGNDTTPSVTETYICAVFVPANATLTGVRSFNGSVAAGNLIIGLFDSTGVNVAATASTAMSGTDAYQQIAFATAYAAIGPATYYIGVQYNNTSARFNTHAFGPFPASKKTGETYGTFTTITPPTTFTANQGQIASLY